MDGNETSECEEDTFSDNGGGDKAKDWEPDGDWVNGVREANGDAQTRAVYVRMITCNRPRGW